MKTYLVGGAVRDELLGLAVTENDWVVVGATPQQMLDQGYRQVGNSFPVFLHPDTGEEYALARTEKKTGAGYGGFAFDFNTEVTLEQDLSRRDLTINAIAKNTTGKLIDPYGGLADLKQRTLRHISEAFDEDPLRILRVARFRAKLDHLGFEIHPKTFTLMQSLSASDELLALSSERIWLELQKGLSTTAPDVFIRTLYQCGALQKILPELNRRFLHSDNLRDTAKQIGDRTVLALRYLAQKHSTQSTGTKAEQLTQRQLASWVICCHALEDNTSPKNLVPRVVSKFNSEKSEVRALCERLGSPNEFKRLAILGSYYLHIIIQARHCNPQLIVDLLDACDAWRKPEQFKLLLLAAECLTSTHSETPQHNLESITLLRQAHKNCLEIKAQRFVDQGITGEAVGEAIRNARKVAVAELKRMFAG